MRRCGVKLERGCSITVLKLRIRLVVSPTFVSMFSTVLTLETGLT